MRVFLSFSGPVSHRVAQVFHDWLPLVIQSLRPYMSSEDIDKGLRWGSALGAELQDTHHGILFVTRSNISSSWLNFEAGALSKSLTESRVTPFLFNVEPTDLIRTPLSLFQATRNNREDVRQLVRSLNAAAQELALGQQALITTFDKWWPELEAKLAEVEAYAATEADEKASVPPVDQNQVLAQIYDLQLQMQRRLNAFEHRLPANNADLVSMGSLLNAHMANGSAIRQWLQLRVPTASDEALNIGLKAALTELSEGKPYNHAVNWGEQVVRTALAMDESGIPVTEAPEA